MGTARAEVIGERGLPLTDDYLRQPVPPPAPAPLNDYLITLADAADVNIIADATSFGANETIASYPGGIVAIAGAQNPRLADRWQATRLNLLADVTDQATLSWLRYDRQTFLFWKEADPLALASLLIEAKAKELASLKVTPLSTKEVHELLRAAFMGAGWDGKSADVAISLKIEDLPIELRNHVLLQMRDWLALSTGTRNSHLWFDADFWRGVQLYIGYEDNGNDPNTLYPFLFLRAATDAKIKGSVGSLYPTIAAKQPTATNSVPLRR